LKSVTTVGVNGSRVVTLNQNGSSTNVYLVDTQALTILQKFTFGAACGVVSTAPLSGSSFVFHCVQTLETCETDFLYIINYYGTNDTFGLTRVGVLPTQYCHSTLVGAKDGNVYLMKIDTTFNITVFSTVTREIMGYDIPGVDNSNVLRVGQPAIIFEKLMVSVQLTDMQECTILFDLLQNTATMQNAFYADAFSPYSLDDFIAWQVTMNDSHVIGRVIESDSFMQDGDILLPGNAYPPVAIASTFSTSDLFVMLSNPTDNQTSHLYEIEFTGVDIPAIAGSANPSVPVNATSSLDIRNSLSADFGSIYVIYQNVLTKFPYTHDSNPPGGSPNVAAIVLGVLFGVAGLILIIVAIVYFIRKRQGYQQINNSNI